MHRGEFVGRTSFHELVNGDKQLAEIRTFVAQGLVSILYYSRYLDNGSVAYILLMNVYTNLISFQVLTTFKQISVSGPLSISAFEHF